MYLGSRESDSDLSFSSPKARLFHELKQKTCSGESFHLLLNESGLHSVMGLGDDNQPQEEGDRESLQSACKLSQSALQTNARPEDWGETVRIGVSGQPQMPKVLLFDRLKQISSALPPVKVADQLSDLQAAKAVARSADSSNMLVPSSVHLAAEQTESTKTLSDTPVPLPKCSSSKREAEFVRNIPERVTVSKGHKGSVSKFKFFAKNPVLKLHRISPNKRCSVVSCNESGVVSDRHAEDHSSTCSPFRSCDLQQVLDDLEDFSAPLDACNFLLPASDSQVEALGRTNDNQEMPYCSLGISRQNRLASAEFVTPQTLACGSKSHSAGDCLLSCKTELNVHGADPLATGKKACYSCEDVQTPSSTDEVFESRPTLTKSTSNINQAGENTDGTNDDPNLTKPKWLSKRLSLRLRKQESDSLSPQGDAAVTVENHLSTASELERGHQNVVELDKWTLRLLSNHHLCVTGYRKDEPGGRLHCSDPVTRCLKRDEVQTVSGTLYRLSGRLCKSIATEAGFSKKFLCNFLDGFPPDWEDLLNKALKSISFRMPGGHTSCVQKVLQEAKPLSDSTEGSRGSSGPVKKVKKVAAKNDSTVAKILTNKGSKNDPLSLQDLPVARHSGRLVIPPLAWWANQRVIIDPTSKETIIMQETENVLGLPALHFKSEKGIPTAELGEKLKSVKTSSKESCAQPWKNTVPKMKEMEVKSSSMDIVKDRRGARPEAGRRKDGEVSKDSVIRYRQQTSIQEKPDEASVHRFHISRGSYRKREIIAKTCRSCSSSSADTSCHSVQKKQRLDNQSGAFSSKDCPQRSQVPQRTLHRTKNHSRKTLSINQNKYCTSDSADSTTGLSRSSRNCNVVSEGNAIALHMRLSKTPKRTLTLHNSQVIRHSEEEATQNSAHQSHEVFLKRTENESEGNEDTSSGRCHKMIPKDNSGQKAGQKKLLQRSSDRAHSASLRYKDDCTKLLNLSLKSRSNSNCEEGQSARRESSRKRTKKHRSEDLNSGEPLELVYTKSDHMQKTIVMRHNSRKRRVCDMKDQPSFLTEIPLLMQDLPPKPRLSRFQASGNLSDLSDSDDSANVEYFFSSDESEM